MFPIRIVIPKEWIDWYHENEDWLFGALLFFGVAWFAFGIIGAKIAQGQSQWAWLGWLGMFFPVFFALGYAVYRGVRWLLPRVIEVKVKRGHLKSKNDDRPYGYSVVAGDGWVRVVDGIPEPIPPDDPPGFTLIAEMDSEPYAEQVKNSGNRS